MKSVLSIRIDDSNLDHHLWNNHGVWWVNYTLLVDGLWQRRSLGTRRRDVARTLRDQLLRFAKGRCNASLFTNK
jgi:hypothetical protein